MTRDEAIADGPDDMPYCKECGAWWDLKEVRPMVWFCLRCLNAPDPDRAWKQSKGE